jgi:hypothetical protein
VRGKQKICADGEKNNYIVDLISYSIQDKDSTGFDLTPDSNYNNFYLTLSGSSLNKDFKDGINGCILNFEFKITDLQTNSIYSKNKKLAVPIKRELITDAYVDLKYVGLGDEINYYYIKD